ncbi:hypothetical protein ACS0OT_07185 [Stenotrophomonas maltophilia group sp. RY12688]|uniref:hypothetical protein n=1 Tax=Stenotrophomonas maltophilia group sp. RY12688 TaxID=3454438 RepID=UPI003F995821
MSKHTPGPWIIDPKFLCEVQTADHKTIASCWERRDAGSHIEVTGTLECSEEVSIANARLIAAAPDLLEALIRLEAELVEDKYGECYEPSPFENLALARAAIAKATGEA